MQPQTTPPSSDKAIAVILAAGSGQRFGSALPKQFHLLGNKPVIAHAIDTMAAHPAITAIYLVCASNYRARSQSLINHLAVNCPITLINGGATRAASTRAALQALSANHANSKVLFHDAVRPFLTAALISRCLNALNQHRACTAATVVTNTIMAVTPTHTLQALPQTRAQLRSIQTPQGFWLNDLAKAYQQLDDSLINQFTDDCGVFMHCFPTQPVATVAGSPTNIKITHPKDLEIAQCLLTSSDEKRD